MAVKPPSLAPSPPDLPSLCLAITEHAPLPIATVEGATHIVRYVNPAFSRLMDKPRDQLLGKPISELLPTKDDCVTLLDRVFRTKKPESHIEQEHSKPHPVFWSYLMWPVVADELLVGVMIQVTETAEFHGKMIAMNEALMLGSVRQHELTEAAENLNAQLRTAQAELANRALQLDGLVAERTAQLQETVAELETFSYSIVHDMRAPLRSMRSFASILQSDYCDKLDKAGQDYLQRIMSSAGRMDALITDVLTYSRIATDEPPVGRVDLDQLVNDIVQGYPQFEQAAGAIHIEHPLPVACGNAAFLTQIISNLLDNALKFVASGREPRVTVRGEDCAGKVRLWVEDNGVGIAPEYHERVFGLFQSLHRRDEYAGTGVGLAIVKKAAERMGGRTGFTSEPGVGSRFWVELDAIE